MAVKKIGDDNKVERRVTCNQCSSILEYLPVDVEQHTKTDYVGDTDMCYYITCPQCKNTIYIERR